MFWKKKKKRLTANTRRVKCFDSKDTLEVCPFDFRAKRCNRSVKGGKTGEGSFKFICLLCPCFKSELASSSVPHLVLFWKWTVFQLCILFCNALRKLFSKHATQTSRHSIYVAILLTLKQDNCFVFINFTFTYQINLYRMSSHYSSANIKDWLIRISITKSGNTLGLNVTLCMWTWYLPAMTMTISALFLLMFHLFSSCIST